jgi:hypothetical protein
MPPSDRPRRPIGSRHAEPDASGVAGAPVESGHGRPHATAQNSPARLRLLTFEIENGAGKERLLREPIKIAGQ